MELRNGVEGFPIPSIFGLVLLYIVQSFTTLGIPLLLFNKCLADVGLLFGDSIYLKIQMSQLTLFT